MYRKNLAHVNMSQLLSVHGSLNNIHHRMISNCRWSGSPYEGIHICQERLESEKVKDIFNLALTLPLPSFLLETNLKPRRSFKNDDAAFISWEVERVDTSENDSVFLNMIYCRWIQSFNLELSQAASRNVFPHLSVRFKDRNELKQSA